MMSGPEKATPLLSIPGKTSEAALQTLPIKVSHVILTELNIAVSANLSHPRFRYFLIVYYERFVFVLNYIFHLSIIKINVYL